MYKSLQYYEDILNTEDLDAETYLKVARALLERIKRNKSVLELVKSAMASEPIDAIECPMKKWCSQDGIKQVDQAIKIIDKGEEEIYLNQADGSY